MRLKKFTPIQYNRAQSYVKLFLTETTNNPSYYFKTVYKSSDRLCGLVVRVPR
jgi:hypothetical protein